MILAQWTAHPAKSRPRDLALVAAVLFMTAGAVMASFQSLWLTFLSAVILIVAVSPFLFPTHYVLSEWGVEERRLWRQKARPWDDLRRVQIGRGAALVSPFRRRSWLDRHRGVMLYLDGADRAAVVSILEDRIGG